MSKNSKVIFRPLGSNKINILGSIWGGGDLTIDGDTTFSGNVGVAPPAESLKNLPVYVY